MRILGIWAAAMIAATSASAVTLYESGFEGTDGGWVSGGFGDWARGAIATPLSGCDAVAVAGPGPSGANGGAEVWGTVLGGCYTNSGATSTLTQSFDLTGATTATFAWAQFYQVFFDFDRGALTANGDTLFAIDSRDEVDWETRMVDLTPYVGGVVTLEFSLFASSVVNLSGWYLDDMRLAVDEGPSGDVPLPPALALLATPLGLLALRRRRRRSRP